MDILSALVLAVLGVALLGGAVALAWPVLRGGPSSSPASPTLPAATLPSEAERQRRFAAAMRERATDPLAGDPVGDLSANPSLHAHRIDDLTGPPRESSPPAGERAHQAGTAGGATVQGDVVAGEHGGVPPDAEWRVNGSVRDNRAWQQLQDEVTVPAPRRGFRLGTLGAGILSVLTLLLVGGVALWLARTFAPQAPPPTGTALILISAFGEGTGNNESATGRALAATLRTGLGGDTAGLVPPPQIEIVGLLTNAGTAERELARRGADALLWGTLPGGDTGTLEATLFLRSTPPLQPWETLGPASRLLLPPAISLPGQSLVVSGTLQTLLRAVIYDQVGRYGPAYEQAASLSDRGNDALRGAAGFITANAQVALGQPAEAARAYALLDAGGWSPPALLNNWGIAAAGVGDVAAARGALDRALAASPAPTAGERARILSNRGWVDLYLARDLPAARADYAAALAADPHQAEAARELGYSAYQEKDVANAHKYTDLAQQNSSTDPATTRLAGLLALLTGNTEDALAQFDNAFTGYSIWQTTLHANESTALASNDTPSALQATDYIRRVQHEQGTTQLFRGIALAEQAKGEASPNAFQQFFQGLHVGPASKRDQAISAFNEAIRLDKDRADVRYQLGVLHRREGDVAAAQTEFARAKELDNTQPGPYEELAAIDVADKKPEAAIKEYQALLAVNPGYVPGYIALAGLYEGLQQGAQAEATYAQALTVGTQRPSDHYYRALALRGLRRDDEARAEVHEAIAANGNDVQAHLLLGQIEQQAGRNAEALQEYATVSKLDAKNSSAPYEAGRILAAEGRTTEAVTQWRMVLARDKKHAGVYFDLGALYEQLGQPAQALAQYSTAINEGVQPIEAYRHRGLLYEAQYKWHEAERDYREVLKRDSDQIVARDGLVNVLVHQYNYDEALKVGQDGRKVQPDSYRPYLELVQASVGKGDPDGAAPALEAARRLAPGAALVYLAEGRVAIARNDDAGARDALGAALAAWPQDADALGRPQQAEAATLLGDNEYNHDRFAPAVAAYEQALTLIPANYPAAHAGLGRAYQRLGRDSEATEQYLAAQRADPLFAEAYLFQGDLEAARGRWTEASGQYNRAGDLRPTWAEARYKRAHAAQQLGRTDDAIREYNAALRIDKNYIEAWFGLGTTYRTAGKRAEAINAFKEAVNRAPTYANAWLYLGYTYEDNGQRPEAAEAYRHARDTASSDASIRAAAEKALAALVP